MNRLVYAIRGFISICRHGLKTRNQSLESIDDGIYDCVRFQRMCNSAERLDGRALMDDLLRSSRMYILALKKNSACDNFEMKCELMKVYSFLFVEIISICNACIQTMGLS